MPTPSFVRRHTTTTLRRTLVTTLFLASTAAAEPISEIELIELLVHTPVEAAHREATHTAGKAERTSTSLLKSPTLDARHERARGPWGATTTAVGATVTVDLGLSPLAANRAAQLSRQEAPAHGEHAALLSVCEARQSILGLWSTQAEADASARALERLQTLHATVKALADAGDVSGYERDRAALEVVAHHGEASGRVHRSHAVRAEVSARIGTPVTAVLLAPVPPTPTLEQVERAVTQHPTLRHHSLARDAARARLAAARRDQLPDLSLSGGPRWDASPDGGDASPGFEVAGSLQLPFTDGSRTEARVQLAALAQADAELLAVQAALEAEAKSALDRLNALRAPEPIDPESVWTAAMTRYQAGETELEALLQTARAVEAATLAQVELERLTRQAHLDLGCSTADFSDPTLEALLESLR